LNQNAKVAIRKFEKLFYKSLTTNDTPIEYYNVKTSAEYTIIDK